MDISLREISLNDDLEGLNVLNKLAKENEKESPISGLINEELYSFWLKEKVLESKIIPEGSNLRDEKLSATSYWILCNEKIIGYADIKHYLNNENLKIGGHIGLILLNEYQNKGIGLKTMNLLIKKAKNEFNINEILITTDVNNIPCRKMCEKLGANLTDIDEQAHYWIK